MAEKAGGEVGSIVQDPPSALYKDPFAPAPLAGDPLRICTADAADPAAFQEYYHVKRPRLIDVFHPRFRFAADTDCARLRAMDAIVTILWSSDQAFSHGFYWGWRNDTYIMTWERSTGLAERFDLVIRRAPNLVLLMLYEKTILDGGECKRNQKPYALVRYRYDVPGDWYFDPVIHKRDKQYIYIGGLDHKTTEDRSRCLARYLLLTRPWERKLGVKFNITATHRDLKEVEREPENSEASEEFYLHHSDPLFKMYEGGILDDEGYPSKIDE